MKISGFLGLTLMAASCSLSVLALAQGANATTISVHSDKDDWINALNGTSFQTEDFSDTTLNPGVSFISDVGRIENGHFWDQVNDDPLQTTTWGFNHLQFPNGIFAWGGDWDLSPLQPGSNVAVGISLFSNGVSIGVGEVSRNLTGDFWGIVSDTSFDEVRLTEGTDPRGLRETYTFDNMVYASTPEPSSVLGIFALSTLGLGSMLKRKF